MENISIAKRTTDPGIDKNKVKLQNLGQTSAWFCLAKGEKCMYQLPCKNIAKGTTDPGVDCFDQ